MVLPRIALGVLVANEPLALVLVMVRLRIVLEALVVHGLPVLVRAMDLRRIAREIHRFTVEARRCTVEARRFSMTVRRSLGTRNAVLGN